MVRDLTAQLKDLVAKLYGKEPPQRPKPDLPAAPDKKPTGRKPGGQPGHPPHLKKRLQHSGAQPAPLDLAIDFITVTQSGQHILVL